MDDERISYEENRVLELLREGKDKAIKIPEIQGITGYKPKDIKYMIMHMRKYYPICSGNNGYWLGNRADMARMLDNFSLEMKTKSKVLNDMYLVYDNMEV